MADFQELLSQSQARVILERALESNQFNLTQYQIQPFHKQLEGLIGEHYTLNIDFSYDNQPESMKFFVKTLSTNKTLRELTNSMNVYEKEKFFYDLLKKMDDYKIDNTYAPKSYLFTDTSVVVLEDLSLQGFQGTNKKEALDLEHCKLCLETLAKFHASTLKYEDAKSEKLNHKFCLFEHNHDILEDKFMTKEENSASRFLKSAIEALFDLIETIPKNEFNFDKEKFKEKLLGFLETGGSKPDENRHQCVLHGDLWSSNFLYRYSEGRPVEAKLLDYQTIAYGFPGLDLMKFLMTNTRKNFRDLNFEKLVHHYFENLSKYLGASLAERWEWEEFRSCCITYKLPAKVHAIVDRSITFMSDETYVDAMKTEESLSKFLFEDRGKYVINSFNTNQEFKELLLEDVRELADFLLV